MIAILLITVIMLSGVLAYLELYPATTPPATNPARYSVVDGRESQNWSGFTVESGDGTTTDVVGTWAVPEIFCPRGAVDYFSSQWVGIDGVEGSATVEQAGMEYDCINGQLRMYAWYEWFPAAPRGFPLSLLVAGDIVTFEVRWNGTSFTASVRDGTQGWGYSRTNSTIGQMASRTSAEWIVEAPGQTVKPLTNFGKLYFSHCYATTNGTKGPMGSFDLHEQTMVDSSGSIKARPVLPLWNDGTSFSVWWEETGP